LHAYIDDAQEQIQYVTWVTNFFCPVVGVVADAGFFVGGYLVAFHYPFDGAFADDILRVGLQVSLHQSLKAVALIAFREGDFAVFGEDGEEWGHVGLGVLKIFLLSMFQVVDVEL